MQHRRVIWFDALFMLLCTLLQDFFPFVKLAKTLQTCTVRSIAHHIRWAEPSLPHSRRHSARLAKALGAGYQVFCALGLF